MRLPNYYTILELRSDATQQEIRAAHRRLARRFHPDMNPDSEWATERFRQVQEAYEVLNDVDKRRAYDYQRTAPPQPEFDARQWQTHSTTYRPPPSPNHPRPTARKQTKDNTAAVLLRFVVIGALMMARNWSSCNDREYRPLRFSPAVPIPVYTRSGDTLYRDGEVFLTPSPNQAASSVRDSPSEGLSKP